MLRTDRYDAKDNNLTLIIDNKDRHKVILQDKKGNIIWIYRDVWQIKAGKNLLKKGKHSIKTWIKRGEVVEITYKN